MLQERKKFTQCVYTEPLRKMQEFPKAQWNSKEEQSKYKSEDGEDIEYNCTNVFHFLLMIRLHFFSQN